MSVDTTCFDMFFTTETKENKVIDLSAILPCFSSFYLQVKRANFVVAIWKRTANAQATLPDMRHGFNINGSVDYRHVPG